MMDPTDPAELRRRRRIDDVRRQLDDATLPPPPQRRAIFSAFTESFRGFGPVLDVGTGDGLFVEILRQAGIEAQGVERDPRRVAEGRSYGRAIAEGEIRDLARNHPAGSFGGVMIANVLEHLDPDDAVGLLLDAASLVRPLGRVACLLRSAGVTGEALWTDVGQRRLYPLDIVAAAMQFVGLQVIGRGSLGPANAYIIGQRSAEPIFGPDQLPFYEDRLYSQNGEDGILRELFSRLGVERGFFVEFGVQDGRECNTAALALEAGWNGVLIEGDAVLAERAAAVYAGRPQVRVVSRFLTRENIAATFVELDVPREFDLLSIDVDGNDYWLWEALGAYRPRIVVMEINPHYPPPSRWVMAYDEAHHWQVDDQYGASLGGLHSLGRRLGYSLLGSDRRPVNAFFVRDDLLEQVGFPALTPEQAYREPSYRFPHREGPSIEAPAPVG